MTLLAAPLRTVDVRTLTGPDRCRTVLGEFDRLQTSESMMVVSGHEPRKLLAHLQADRSGLFEWSPLEAGPETWRTEITRRDPASGAMRGVAEALAWDHDRLEAIERRVFDARQADDFTQAGRAFAEFDLGLRRHIRFEEQILFPAFEQSSGLLPHGGPTGVMRAEHRAIEALLEAILEVVRLPGRGAESLREQLHGVLGGHNLKEEKVLYPGIDRLLGQEESDAIVRRIQAS
jgi:regulator of cell morphogenesis and NO signaling